MSGRRPHPTAPAHGKHRKRRRGTHKRATSPETAAWNEHELIPKRPPWMPAETYTKLANLRGSL